MRTDTRLPTEDYVRQAQALRVAEIAALFTWVATRIFRRKPLRQISFG